MWKPITRDQSTVPSSPSAEEVELRVAGGEHRVCDAAVLDRATQCARRVPRRGFAERR
jgi:hypothetical protein